MFLTGSRAYGTPRPDSDIDVVCYLPDGTLRATLEQFGVRVPTDSPWRDDKQYAGRRVCYFGNLNLILVGSEREYEAWRTVTRELIKQRPVTRAYAKGYFETRLAALGVPKWPDVGPGPLTVELPAGATRFIELED